MAVIEKELVEINMQESLKPDVTLITAAVCNKLIEARKMNAGDEIINSALINLAEMVANTKGSAVALRQLQLD